MSLGIEIVSGPTRPAWSTMQYFLVGLSLEPLDHYNYGTQVIAIAR